ncbi:hypothetical protein SADUNF_Sadunf03G0165500 [Salix dunnii]|uniref:Rieske domain-containing protein n=1 Tax=Salix dunnii TaxID=1413687 RepID=A0A835TFB0_9ROSI|nr:hypothetical protein SADUNF_Sadunf03G0165500 [Salix dunnii]
MEALFAPSVHISTSPTSHHKTPFNKFRVSFSLLKFPVLPMFLTLGKTTSKSHSFTTRSSSSAVSAEDEPETAKKEEKFDWYAQWYPVMPVCDLDKRKPHAKKVMGLDLVVWWDRNESEWKVFDDTCPHRLAPLSEGRIDQWGRLQCVYHGWCFNASGDCKFIPQAPPDGPPVHTSMKACVAVYPSTVQHDIVWFWPNIDPRYKDIITRKQPPFIPELDDPSFTKYMGNRDFPYGYDVLIENELDPAHLPYAHYGLANALKPQVKSDREGGGPIDLSVKKLDSQGFFENQDHFGDTKFIAPCISYASSSPGDAPEKERKLMDVAPANWQKACFVPTKSDALLVGYRRWFNKYSGGQVDWKGKYCGALPPTSPREQLFDRPHSLTPAEMEALNVSFVPSPHIPATPAKVIRRSQFLHFHFSSTRSSFVQSYDRNKSSSKILTALSSSISTETLDPTEPALETDSQQETFDWYAQWYAVMPVCDLDKRVPHAKKVIGLDLVVWWDRNESEWKVFDDTCPHRLAPLSEGRIDQWGRLQCVYHGWCFNGSGDCKFIPQAPPDGPPVHTFKKACVAAYPATVQNDIVWFWPNSSPEYKDILSSKKPPYIAELDDPSYSKTMGNREFPFGYEILIENLVDPAHVPYAHFKLLPVKLDREGGAPIDITINKLDIEGFHASRFGGITNFMAPCVYKSAFSLPSKKGNEPQRRGLLLFFCVPVGPGKSRLIYTFPRNFGVWLDRVMPRWVFHLSQNRILDSDLYLLHLEERKIMEVGPKNWQKACFVPTKSDAQVVAFRKWLKTYSGGQINWGGKFSGTLPPTPPKEQLMDRYRSHVVNCSSCSLAYKSLNAVEVALQVISFGSIGVVAATKQNAMPAAARTSLVLMAILCFAASRWLAHFIYKNFHFHDYNHALL